MYSFNVARGSALLITLIFLAVACKSASYEFVKEDDKTIASPEEVGSPKEFGPDGEADPTPTPTNPGDGDGDNNGDPNLPPSADVEAIDNGKATTKIKVGRTVIIRPTIDTADADDIGVSSCINPGIVEATYQVDGKTETASRSQGCESLNINHRFDTPGDYRITMVVTSDEGETATAEMILTVIPEDAPEADTDGGFEISADPIIAGKGQKIVFTGRCDSTTKTTITWDFKDGGNGTGKQVTHRYETTGQFEVDATCTDADGKTKTAKITIVVIDSPIFPDGVEDPNLNDQEDPDDTDPTPTPGPDGDKDPNDDPGQIPGQNRSCSGYFQYYPQQNRCGYR